MAQQSTEQLNTRTEQIRTETTKGANTAQRLGSVLTDLNENKQHKGEPLLLPELSTAQKNALTGLLSGDIINHGGVLELWNGSSWKVLTPDISYDDDDFEIIDGVLRIKQVLIFNSNHFELVNGILSLKNP
jgi:hypothetical protein